MSLLLDENLIMQEVTLCSRLQRELGESHCVDASQASQLGSLITREFLDALDRGNQNQRNEYDKLVDFLSNIRFQGSDGQFHAAADLLMRGEGEGAGNPDEHLRAAFAPANRLLADDYAGSALDFFKACRKACRQEFGAPAQLMATWAIEASGTQTRRAVLQYILDGELPSKVASEIRERIEGTWLNELNESPLLTDQFDRWEQLKILAELRLLGPGIIIPPPDPVLDTSSVLEDIHAWWTREAGDHIRKYEKIVYGDFSSNVIGGP